MTRRRFTVCALISPLLLLFRGADLPVLTPKTEPNEELDRVFKSLRPMTVSEMRSMLRLRAAMITDYESDLRLIGQKP